MAKFTYAEINATIDAFNAGTHKHSGKYDFACGFLSSTLARVMVDLPKHKQAEILQAMNNVLATQQPSVC